MELNTPHRIGDCESCDATNVRIRPLHARNMWFCDKCYEIEIQAQVDNARAKLHIQVPGVNPVNNAVAESAKLDSTIQVKTDLFNAATVAIQELKAQIDADTSIENKPFALASELMTRFNHFKNVVFELNQKIVEAGNQQKAIQVYLNQLANSLREEERNKLKLENINYKPTVLKPITAKAIRTTTKKIDKVELRKYAAELGVSEFTLQMIVVQKGIPVVEAAKILRRSIKESQSETN